MTRTPDCRRHWQRFSLSSGERAGARANLFPAIQNPKSKIQNPPLGSFGFRYSGFFRHSSLVIRTFLLLSSILTATAQPKSEPPRPPPLDPVQAEKEARILVHDILSQVPDKNSTNTGVLKIRDAQGNRREIPIRFEVFSTPTNWVSIYQTTATINGPGQKLIVIHNGTQPNQYHLANDINPILPINPTNLMVPFANSDFWLGDLGLEFFHWPKQRLLKKELRRGQSCDVLESTNPQPGSNTYSRVVCWIDIDPPHGIIHADAFDSKGELLKQFDPKKLEKVHGQYQLESMEIRNHKTGSRTLIEFLDLDK